MLYRTVFGILRQQAKTGLIAKRYFSNDSQARWRELAERHRRSDLYQNLSKITLSPSQFAYIDRILVVNTVIFNPLTILERLDKFKFDQSVFNAVLNFSHQTDIIHAQYRQDKRSHIRQLYTPSGDVSVRRKEKLFPEYKPNIDVLLDIFSFLLRHNLLTQEIIIKIFAKTNSIEAFFHLNARYQYLIKLSNVTQENVDYFLFEIPLNALAEAEHWVSIADIIPEWQRRAPEIHPAFLNGKNFMSSPAWKVIADESWELLAKYRVGQRLIYVNLLRDEQSAAQIKRIIECLEALGKTKFIPLVLAHGTGADAERIINWIKTIPEEYLNPEKCWCSEHYIEAINLLHINKIPKIRCFDESPTIKEGSAMKYLRALASDPRLKEKHILMEQYIQLLDSDCFRYMAPELKVYAVRRINCILEQLISDDFTTETVLKAFLSVDPRFYKSDYVPDRLFTLFEWMIANKIFIENNLIKIFNNLSPNFLASQTFIQFKGTPEEAQQILDANLRSANEKSNKHDSATSESLINFSLFKQIKKVGQAVESLVSSLTKST